MPGTDGDRRAGIVLAGGSGARFGDADKVTVDVAGTPMVARTVARVGRAVDGVVVSCRRDGLEAVRSALAGERARVAVVPDPAPDRGPVAGLAAAVRPVGAPRVAVVAADNPLVDPAFLGYLFERAAGEAGAVPALGGRPHPTQAVFRRDALEAGCRAVLADGGASLDALVAAVDPVVVPEAEVLEHADRASFSDVNTPEDLRAVVAALRADDAG